MRGCSNRSGPEGFNPRAPVGTRIAVPEPGATAQPPESAGGGAHIADPDYTRGGPMSMDDPEVFRRLHDYSRPTGLDHTHTPWKAADVEDQYLITDNDGQWLAIYRRAVDRDLALYFTNIHAGFIALLAGFGGAFDVLTGNCGDGFSRFAEQQAELARIYGALFKRLGKPEQHE